MNYFSTHKEFIDRFGITEDDFNKARCKHWIGSDVLNVHRIVRTREPLIPIRRD